MANKHIKRCPILLVIREMQIQTTRSSHFHPPHWLIYKAWQPPVLVCVSVAERATHSRGRAAASQGAEPTPSCLRLLPAEVKMDCWAQMRWKSCSQNRKALETTCVPLTGKWLVVSDMFTQWMRLCGSRKEWATSIGESPKCQTHRGQAHDFIHRRPGSGNSLRRRGKQGSGHRRVRGCGTDQEGQTDSLPAGNLCVVCRGGPEVHLSNDDFRSDHFDL